MSAQTRRCPATETLWCSYSTRHRGLMDNRQLACHSTQETQEPASSTWRSCLTVEGMVRRLATPAEHPRWESAAQHRAEKLRLVRTHLWNGGYHRITIVGRCRS